MHTEKIHGNEQFEWEWCELRLFSTKLCKQRSNGALFGPILLHHTIKTLYGSQDLNLHRAKSAFWSPARFFQLQLLIFWLALPEVVVGRSLPVLPDVHLANTQNQKTDGDQWDTCQASGTLKTTLKSSTLFHPGRSHFQRYASLSAPGSRSKVQHFREATKDPRCRLFLWSYLTFEIPMILLI